ncbi:sensor histidine kinase [Cohnella rhizosphaerae]|uniref:Histidine kinase n=1 Tax=Cohnella rhizosphaerae TaxID=1457232 RepID=A0A9X4KTK3_9BACL|nr:histidine kinase [Cohnella rhizosphaerae]MDG0810001.1 histidine kinase [Cohnella rhizosphaerae]
MLVTLHGLIEKSFTEEIERRQLQLELLQAQINPHFLYNTLDLINCRAILSGDKETGGIVRALANMLRYGLNRGQTWISLEGEIRHVEAYLHIQRLLMDDLAVDIRVPDDLLSASMLHFCLQPLAENAIVHGFAGRTEGCRIAIEARLDGISLRLRVQDNGVGCDAEAMNRMLEERPIEEKGNEADDRGASEADVTRAASPAKSPALASPSDKDRGGSGYGTLNVHRRIRLYCGEAFGLKYVQTAEGTCVEAVLPFRPNLNAAPAPRRYEHV